MRKVAVLSSASGNGKTTVGRDLAARLDVRFVELDVLATVRLRTQAEVDRFLSDAGGP